MNISQNIRYYPHDLNQNFIIEKKRFNDYNIKLNKGVLIYENI